MLTNISLLIQLYITPDNTMRERTVVIRLFVSGVIYLMVNSILLLVIGALNCIPAYLYNTFLNTNVEKFFILSSFVFYYLLFLFTLLYAVMTVIGTILGFFSQIRIRKIGVTILIITNLIILPFIVVNCVLIYFAFKLDNKYSNSTLLPLPAYFSIAVSVCQCILFVYSIFHIIVICTSFRNRIGNRQSEEYEETEMVGAN